MTTTEHAALDVPRGVRIVAPAQVAGATIAGGIVHDVAYRWPTSGGPGAVDLLLDGDTIVTVPPTLVLTVDQDTPERRARLLFAQSILSHRSTP